MAHIFSNVRDALQALWRQPRYLVFAAVLGSAALALSVWANNVPLVRLVLVSPDFTLTGKVLLLARLVGGLVTGFSALTVFLLLVMAVLFGINGALAVYCLSHRQRVHGRASSLLALVSGVFGAGCASCGTYLLGATLASVGAAGLLPFLPLGGREFLLVSIVLLAVSIMWSSRSLVSAGVCPVTVRK